MDEKQSYLVTALNVNQIHILVVDPFITKAGPMGNCLQFVADVLFNKIKNGMPVEFFFFTHGGDYRL